MALRVVKLAQRDGLKEPFTLAARGYGWNRETWNEALRELEGRGFTWAGEWACTLGRVPEE